MILVPRRQLIWSGVMFTIGVGLTSYGGYMSMVNIGPSQERFRARSEYVRKRLREMVNDD
uniref:Transmembrane protein n=1 Tax=Kalanchoe fedtschenkoi TaxID=63787 RepID=A0A7N0UWX8_KALFE